MSHKCVRCGITFEDNDTNILRGCPKCGSVFFLYVKGEEDVKEIKAIEEELKHKETTLEEQLEKQIEKERKKEKKEEKKEEEIQVLEPSVEEVKFGVETIRVPKEGVYEINIEGLLRKRPLIILERGRVYFIHLPSLFGRVK
jgi:predicted  nucleic acid-binding Zn-ribbon protein